MKGFLVELYQPAPDPRAAAADAARAREAAQQLTREGTPVRYVRFLLIPDDETCFHLFEGVSAEAVGQASRRAALDYERVVEAVQ
jgi:hypothetical protein